MMLPAAAVRDSHSTESSLYVHLQDAQFRPEAFPWGPIDNVEMQASFAAGRYMVSLPCKVDVSEVIAPGAEEEQLGAATSLDVEIIGNDNGVAFTIGNASVPLPPGRELQQTSISDNQFRASLRSATGARTGTLVGSFQVCGSTSLGLGADEAAITTALPQAGSTVTDCSAGPAAGEAADGREAKEHGTSGEHVAGSDREGLEIHAMELLEAATKILSSPTPSLGQTPGSAVGPRAACKSVGRKDSKDLPPSTQVPRAHPTADSVGDREVNFLAVGFESSPSSKKEEEEGLHDGPRFPTKGFKFEPTTGSVEWHRIASVNVSKLEREGDLQTLKQFLPEIAVGKVEDDDFDANPGLVNAFRLAQLQTQYVLHCQQVLQRQRDELQSTIGGMELETKGNSNGTTALKHRARLLRKESRKQDKIINGYAAMLRTHNPGLASKVFLDEKGRLKVKAKAKVHEAKERLGGGKRKTRRRNQDAREDGTPADKGCSGGTDDESGFVSGVSSGGSSSSNHWPEAGGLAPRMASPPKRSPATAPGYSNPDIGEAAVPALAGRREGFAVEQCGSSASAVSPGTPPLGRRGRTADDVVQVRSRRKGTGSASPRSRDPAVREFEQSAAENANRESRPKEFEQPDPEEEASVSPRVGDDWAGMVAVEDPSSSGREAMRSSSNDEVTRRSEEEGEAYATIAERRALSPRMVTVSAKPKNNEHQRPASVSSSKESNGEGPLPQQQWFRPGENSLPEGSTNPSPWGHGNGRRGDHTATPRSAVTRGGSDEAPGMRLWITSATGGDNGTPSRAGGANISGLAVGKEHAMSVGARDGGTKVPARGHPALATKLGFEGDGFPDASEFDLDDISEIDVGGELVLSEGGASSSS